jgi:hypothetical protein
MSKIQTGIVCSNSTAVPNPVVRMFAFGTVQALGVRRCATELSKRSAA